jgi:hypothetical protein
MLESAITVTNVEIFFRQAVEEGAMALFRKYGDSVRAIKW